MAAALPPSEGRFDPITGLWTNPDGLPADPERVDADPDGRQPVALVGPVPPELAEPASAVGTSGSGPTPAQRLRWVILALVLVAVIALVVASVAATIGRGSSQPAGVLLDPEHVLATHCGIDELQHQGYWYERVGGVLDDGNGNPPAGWNTPAQLGRLSALDDDQPPTRVVYTDDQGHREEFVLRPGATSPKRMCA